MKKLLKPIIFVVCLFLMISLVSCTTTDEKINEATSPLNEKIASLNEQITELNSEITKLEGQLNTLESENKALEAEKADLEAKIDALEIEIVCASGRHFYDEENEVQYSWDANLITCSASFSCSVCEENAVVSASNITTDEDGVHVATFEGNIPQNTYSPPVFTGVSFNSNSDAYDEAANTFRLNSDTPLVITFEGKNLNNINASNEHILAVGTTKGFYLFDYICESKYGIFSVTDTTVTVTFDPDKVSWQSEDYGYINRFMIYDLEPETACQATLLNINVRFEGENYEPIIDADGYTLVSNAEELESALLNAKKIRFAADIESETGFDVNSNVIIDLAGYDLTVTGEGQVSFWIFENCEILDSVGGSNMALGINVNAGTLKFSDSITLAERALINIFVNCSLDLSDYNGVELHIYVNTDTVGVTIPEGYSFYDSNGVAETVIYHIYVRPTQESVSE